MGAGTKGSVDGVGQVFLVRFRDQDGQSLKACFTSYVTARNGGFQVGPSHFHRLPRKRASGRRPSPTRASV